MSEVTPKDLQVFSERIATHLAELRELAITELAALLALPVTPEARFLRFEVTFDTMGGPITAYLTDADGNFTGWMDSMDTRALLSGHTIYPMDLMNSDDRCWDDLFTNQAMGVVAVWFQQIWQQAVGRGFLLPAYLFSYSYDTPEQFNLRTGFWEQLP